MKDKKAFYIGWQEDMPAGQKSFFKKILIPLFIVIPILVGLVVSFQRPYNAHHFELGNVKAFTGVYHEKPGPILEVEPNALPDGTSNAILLVGYGKFGAEGIMQGIENTKGSLDGKKISILGTLIYGDGKTVLELTKKENSLIEIHETASLPGNKQGLLTKVGMSGEILDPKCYFGVMKPGEGKVHKSCAIRCISGGIPPVFRSGKSGSYTYHILLGKNGEKINQAILQYVGEEIALDGRTGSWNGWDVFYLDGVGE